MTPQRLAEIRAAVDSVFACRDDVVRLFRAGKGAGVGPLAGEVEQELSGPLTAWDRDTIRTEIQERLR